MKKALITGVRGQDGAYLAKLLLEKGHDVYGADRRSSEGSFSKLRYLGVEDDVKILYMDLLEFTNVIDIIKKLQPDEIYNLAAQSFVKASFDQPLVTAKINSLGVLSLLEAVRHFSPHSKFYQASTSEMFGEIQASPQNEKTPFHPSSPYAASKLFSHWTTVNYRNAYGLFCCSGILFNHESPLRGLEFVTRKITHTAAKIKYGLADKLVLGNLEAKRDWGYAAEYVEAMRLMLRRETADDYVVATGKNHTVKEFVERCFKVIDMDIIWEGEGRDAKGIDKKSNKTVVEVSPEFYRPTDVHLLLGDASKAKKDLGWEAETGLEKLVEIMMEADLKRIAALKS